MILTAKGRYAVMAIVDLFQQKEGKPIKLSEIAERNNISASYLEQIFLNLKKRDIVKSVRGPGGGYVLGRPGKEINIADIIRAIGESVKITSCGGKKNCNKNLSQCQTHHLWQGLENNIYKYLQSISLQDVCR